jgi:hypothetical protein
MFIRIPYAIHITPLDYNEVKFEGEERRTETKISKAHKHEYNKKQYSG